MAAPQGDAAHDRNSENPIAARRSRAGSSWSAIAQICVTVGYTRNYRNGSARFLTSFRICFFLRRNGAETRNDEITMTLIGARRARFLLSSLCFHSGEKQLAAREAEILRPYSLRRICLANANMFYLAIALRAL